MSGPVLLVIMDGVGLGPADEGNAVHLARTPTLDRLLATCPNTRLAAHGRAVGLPTDDDMGNSEVGHNALGAGRVFDQGATLVLRALGDGSLLSGAPWREVLGGEALHFIGLLSDGNVHSHEQHLYALLEAAAAAGKRRLYVHALLDGRDVLDHSAHVYLERLEGVLAGLRAQGIDARVASGGGRMVVTMDRYEADWRIVERGWRAHVLADAPSFPTAVDAVLAAREATPGISDQDLPPFVVDGGVQIQDGDAVVFFNYRGDRAIEISRAFEREVPFDRVRRPQVIYAGMMQYDGDLELPGRFLVQPPAIEGTLSEVLVHAGVTSWACSETQKYGHVTYFWNGNRAEPIDPRLDVWHRVDSDRVPFQDRPWMKAAEITDATIDALERHQFLRINFANGDMVGHTGHRDATVMAVEAVDLCLARLSAAVAARGGVLVVTADHGNADEMWKRSKAGQLLTVGGQPVACTTHSLAPVPFIVEGARPGLQLRPGGLGNVAGTLAQLLRVPSPDHFLPSLIV